MTETELLHALNILILLVLTFGLAMIVASLVILDFLRHLLDALNTIALRESERRAWTRKENGE